MENLGMNREDMYNNLDNKDKLAWILMCSNMLDFLEVSTFRDLVIYLDAHHVVVEDE